MNEDTDGKALRVLMHTWGVQVKVALRADPSMLLGLEAFFPISVTACLWAGLAQSFA